VGSGRAVGEGWRAVEWRGVTGVRDLAEWGGEGGGSAGSEGGRGMRGGCLRRFEARGRGWVGHVGIRDAVMGAEMEMGWGFGGRGGNRMFGRGECGCV
jgi:hypothetical protein